jgi:hypothetical protein
MYGNELDSDLASDDVRLVNHSWGVIPRAVDELFKTLMSKQKGVGVPRVTCSIMQIYNDKLYDSLADSKLLKPLKIREFAQSRGKKNEDGSAAAEVGRFQRERERDYSLQSECELNIIYVHHCNNVSSLL